ncbi:hypothetical protein C8N47_11040 [Mangrovibacterium marinum]|uniref:Uncharacterized protein n=1 Tax=Mangrovibacterium marinum TaxID=1639118 RepID=A0A2T5C0T4_9BACT|nr:hypothetical protein C8N47_11040 [Mangrovibacterium marinum]
MRRIYYFKELATIFSHAYTPPTSNHLFFNTFTANVCGDVCSKIRLRSWYTAQKQNHILVPSDKKNGIKSTALML